MQQITVLVPNHLGIAAEITCALAERHVNIFEINVDAIDDHGVIVLTVDKYDLALRTLKERGFQAVTQNAILIELIDQTGALASIAVRLRDANLDLRSMHIIRRDAGKALVSLVASDNIMAAQVLADVLVVDPPR